MATGLNSLVGLALEKKRADICIKATKASNEICGHILLHGIGGVGKTAFARAIASDLGYIFIEREASTFKTRDDITSLLKNVDEIGRKENRPPLIFIDEVHRLSTQMQEAFYYPMKEWTINTADGPYKMRPFCLIAATTRRDMLDEASFVKRFEHVWQMDRYADIYICDILAEIFHAAHIGYSPKILTFIAARCFGIPRQAHNLAKKIKNYILARGGVREIRMDDISETFDLEGMDEVGLTKEHVKYLKELFMAEGVQKGLGFLAGRLGQNEDVVQGYIEPILLNLGFIDRGPRGRFLTPAGSEHLKRCKHI